MRKPALKSLAGAAVLLIVGAHIASAGPDGTCAEYRLDETAASDATEPNTPVPSAVADYMKLAQTAPAVGYVTTVSASAKTDALDTSPRGKQGEVEKKQTDSLLNERQASDAPEASVFQTDSDGY
jgi:hypothetical protein